MRVQSLDHLVLTVADLDAARAFYARLGMVHETFRGADGTARHALRFGDQKINLHQAGAEIAPHAGRPGPGTADLCFLGDGPVEDWVAHLERAGVEIELGPVPRTGATGPIRSVYVRDPDGNLIELAARA